MFFHLLGIIIPTDSYFSEGLKPPTSHTSPFLNVLKLEIPIICVHPSANDAWNKRLNTAINEVYTLNFGALIAVGFESAAVGPGMIFWVDYNLTATSLE
jgi:hypothetical protein